MAKVTWLGEDHLHRVVTPDGRTEELAGPSFTTAFGKKFPKGEVVELRIIKRGAMEAEIRWSAKGCAGARFLG